jgi:hypothetical protein
MTKIEDGYKACCQIDGVNHSFIYTRNNMSDVIYKEGEPAIPIQGSGPLCVFPNMFAAVTFVNRNGAATEILELYPYETRNVSLVIWKCKYTRSSKKYVWRLPREKKLWCIEKPIKILPSHTVLADTVTITEKVWEKIVIEGGEPVA